MGDVRRGGLDNDDRAREALQRSARVDPEDWQPQRDTYDNIYGGEEEEVRRAVIQKGGVSLE